MKKHLLFTLALTATISLLGCNKSPQQADSKPETKAVATADSVGVPECDDYLNRYKACLTSKVPEAARTALNQSLEQTRAAWRSAAANAGAKEALASTCKQSREALKASLSAYGCTDL